MTVPVFLLATVAAWFAVAYWGEKRARERAERARRSAVAACRVLDRLLVHAMDALEVADAALVDVAHERLVECVSWYGVSSVDEALRDQQKGARRNPGQRRGPLQDRTGGEAA